MIQPNGETINGREVIQRVLAGETMTGITEMRGVYFDNRQGLESLILTQIEAGEIDLHVSEFGLKQETPAPVHH